MKTLFRNLFFLELLVIGAVILTFKLIETRLTAGFVAGTIFVALGLVILALGIKNSPFRKSATFRAGCVHLFLSSFPLMITRLLNQAGAFDDVRVLGLSGPTFHRLSTTIYLILLAATLYDWLRGALSLKRSQA